MSTMRLSTKPRARELLVGVPYWYPPVDAGDRQRGEREDGVSEQRGGDFEAIWERQQVGDVAALVREAERGVAEQLAIALGEMDREQAGARIGVAPVHVVFGTLDDEVVGLRRAQPESVDALVEAVGGANGAVDAGRGARRGLFDPRTGIIVQRQREYANAAADGERPACVLRLLMHVEQRRMSAARPELEIARLVVSIVATPFVDGARKAAALDVRVHEAVGSLDVAIERVAELNVLEPAEDAAGGLAIDFGDAVQAGRFRRVGELPAQVIDRVTLDLDLRPRAERRDEQIEQHHVVACAVRASGEGRRVGRHVWIV
jgi:hypothetical protein